VSTALFFVEVNMGIIKDVCSRCGRKVLPGSLHKMKNTSRIMICSECQRSSALIQKRVEEHLATIVSILYPLT